jgi:hypothetical protein
MTRSLPSILPSLLPSLLVSLLALAGCGDDGTSPDASPSGIDATSSIDAAVGTEGVACGGAEACTEICCLGGDDSTPVCADPCPASHPYDFACDGPEDCGGAACCGSLATGVACAEVDACPDDVAQYCHVGGDCPTGECCLPLTIGGLPFGACVAMPGC